MILASAHTMDEEKKSNCQQKITHTKITDN